MGILIMVIVIGGIIFWVGGSLLMNTLPLDSMTDEALDRRLQHYYKATTQNLLTGKTDVGLPEKIRLLEVEKANRTTARMASAIGRTTKELEEQTAKFRATGMTEKEALAAVMKEWKSAQR